MESPVPQMSPPRLIALKDFSFSTVKSILAADSGSTSLELGSTSGTPFRRIPMLTIVMAEMSQNNPSNPNAWERKGADSMAIPKEIPMLPPRKALARVRTSGRVKSAIRAKIAELTAPAP